MLLPNNQEAEVAVVGSVLLKQNALLEVPFLKPDDFYFENTKAVFSAILEMQHSLQPIDVLTVSDWLEKAGKLENPVGGSGFLASCVNQTASPSSIVYHAKTIKKLALARRLIYFGVDIPKQIENGADAKIVAENAMSSLTALVDTDEHKTDSKSLIDKYQEEQLAHSEKIERGMKYVGIPCGFDKLDEKIDGIRKGHFWVIGGYTSAGKTYFSLNIAKNLIKQKKRVVYFSLEMSQVDIMSRLIGLIAEVPPMMAMKGLVHPDDRDKVEGAKNTLYYSNLAVYSELQDIDEIKMAMMAEHMKMPVDCFFLDYIQLITSHKSEKEYEVMRSVSTQLQAFCRKMNIPVIAMSQVSNESAKTESAIIGYKGAGNIAASADFGLELRLDESDLETLRMKIDKGLPTQVKCAIKKNRHGKVGAVDFWFNGLIGEFMERES